MKEICIKSEEMAELAERVIDAEPSLAIIRDAGVRIGYVVSDKERMSSGMAVYGECKRVQPVYQAFMPYDYIITFYGPHTAKLDERQLEILMHHELLHIDITGGGELTYKVRPHDVQDFSEIIDRYGMRWTDETDG